jgi:uncharacterized protein (TIGR02118 family)
LQSHHSQLQGNHDKNQHTISKQQRLTLRFELLHQHTYAHVYRLAELPPGFRGVSVEHGIAGEIPGTEVAYVAMCHFLFDSAESFIAAFTPHAAALQGDMPSYTNIEPVTQINEVPISR